MSHVIRRCAIAVLAVAALAALLPLQAGAQAQSGGAFLYAFRRNCPDTLNQHLSNNTQCRMVARHVLDNLVAVNTATGAVTPWLAESWEITGGGRIYTFRLRRGVKFHDGTPFNAEAVRFNFEWTMSPDRPRKGFRYIAMGGTRYIKTDVLDEYTVRVYFREPHGAFLTFLSDGGTGIDSPAALRRLGDEYGNRGLIGTGPFMLQEWVRNDRVVLQRNPEYNWGARIFGRTGAAPLERITYRDMPEDPARAAAVETGEIHAAQVTEPDAAALRGKANVRIVLVPKAGTVRMLLLNGGKSPTNDLKVRQAINAAINKPQLIRLPAWANIGRPAIAVLPSNMVPPEYRGQFNRLRDENEFDVERAKRLLEEAGWRPGPDGIRVKGSERLVLDHVIISTDAIWSQPMQAMLRAIGVEMRFRPGDFNFWIGTTSKGDFTSTIISDSGADAAGMAHEFFRTGAVYNYWGIRNAEVDRLLDVAVAASDLETRWQALIPAMRLINQSVPGVFGWEQDYVFAARTNVEGLLFNEVGYPYFAATTLRP
jgi:peptide/nickel transport system substrate-binding protein